MPLTHTIINRLTPSEKCIPSRPDKHSDSDGLQLWVRHTGNKVWVSAYRWQGKQQSLTLGKYPVITLQQARQRNLEIKQLIHEGINPKEKKKEKAAERDGSRLFDTIAQAWYADRKTFLASSTFSRNYSAYTRDVKPIIGHKLIDDITQPDIVAIGKAVEARGANEMARRTMAQVGQIFKHAICIGLVKSNPALGSSGAIKPHRTRNHSRITSREIPQLLRDIKSYGGHLPVKLGLLFLCYTFVRTNELRFMQWSEIDYEQKVWRIPANKMKMDRPHIVPLAPQVLTILEQIKQLGFSDQYVFFNSGTKKPYSQNSLINALYNMGYKYQMTGHGFRGLASTTLHEQGFMHEAIDLQLAHEQEDKTSRAYNGAQHLDYRKDMMNQWADFVDSKALTI